MPDVNGLPAWADMSDLDKGAAVLHLHKREWEGGDYAAENYPARYFNDPALTALDPAAASAHAASMEIYADALSFDEIERLYDGALEADRVRGGGS